jgi:hypothetical protein
MLSHSLKTWGGERRLAGAIINASSSLFFFLLFLLFILFYLTWTALSPPFPCLLTKNFSLASECGNNIFGLDDQGPRGCCHILKLPQIFSFFQSFCLPLSKSYTMPSYFCMVQKRKYNKQLWSFLYLFNYPFLSLDQYLIHLCASNAGHRFSFCFQPRSILMAFSCQH